ncbi:MAG: bifunctional phosphoribosyl-AMP cyclohydrolase/phosphoribosyl-ATP diphosphatase HisIE [Lachnospiraceae bacterium]|nr:bifunctional phosphoribosyl-AMP cyclohydrolase/phosphoribosyl-ATP diphosphatase HisIE [Lachnospiraceae bacterium]
MMNYCNIIPKIYIKNGKLMENGDTGRELELTPVSFCEQAENNGADEILIYELSENDSEHDTNISVIKEIADATDIPFLLGGNIKRLEDVKKYIYAGAKMAVLDAAKDSNIALIKEASERFGWDKIAIRLDVAGDNHVEDISEKLIDVCIDFSELGASLIITDEIVSDKVFNAVKELPVKILLSSPVTTEQELSAAAGKDILYGFSSEKIIGNIQEIMDVKQRLYASGMNVNVFESSMKFSDFKLNSDGHLTVVVQDYKTNEVLMVAYMNEEAFQKTLATGKMTYYSRERKELWRKGQTSGHFQFVKSLTMDCDNDTMLAKVKQIGAACHTGNRSCFFNTLVKKEYDETNPLMVFEDVFNVIRDRKIHPKEGSYTNYLFDKGIDKILKKVGEEATEIVIAAKNPDKEEIKYEISDFLYHVMVLMAEKDVSWEEITRELARR